MCGGYGVAVHGGAWLVWVVFGGYVRARHGGARRGKVLRVW